MSEEVTTSFWISFFVEAGIPPAASANYAIIFSDNRIQKHMLLDLNKEYLKDMGINILGDIIAILKHAKAFHEKAAREKVLADKGPTAVQTSVLKATQHLNDLLLKDETVKTIAADLKPAPTMQSVKPSPPKKIKLVKVSEKVSNDEEPIREDLEELKRKVIPPSQVQTQTKKVVSSSTPQSAKKTSVFERLGDSNVTSTTSENPDSSVAAKSSVFQRLGNKSAKEAEASEEAKPTPKLLVSKKQITGPPLPKKVVTVIKPIKKETTLRMDQEDSAKQSAKQRLQLRGGTEKPQELKRIVSNESSASSTTARSATVAAQRTVRPPTVVSQIIKSKTKIQTVKPSVVTTGRADIKQRLGSVSAVSTSTTSNGSVFRRLGVTRGPT